MSTRVSIIVYLPESSLVRELLEKQKSEHSRDAKAVRLLCSSDPLSYCNNKWFVQIDYAENILFKIKF